MEVTWDEFKVVVSKNIEEDKCLIYRGQANSKWTLKTTLHRTGLIWEYEHLIAYFNIFLPKVQEAIEAWDHSRRDLKNRLEREEFLGFLQHQGFPTPLLDWTYSAYIAAYFAIENINHFAAEPEKIAIYSFDYGLWQRTFEQTLDHTSETQHVSILTPSYRGNHKQMLQQGVFLFTNVENIEEHIRVNEEDKIMEFLVKYEILVTERKRIRKELNAMNITAMQLMPSIESVCKKVYEELFCAYFEVQKAS